MHFYTFPSDNCLSGCIGQKFESVSYDGKQNVYKFFRAKAHVDLNCSSKKVEIYNISIKE